MLKKLREAREQMRIGYTAAKLLHQDAELRREVDFIGGRDEDVEDHIGGLEGKTSFEDYCAEHCPEYPALLKDRSTHGCSGMEGKVSTSFLIGVAAYEARHKF